MAVSPSADQMVGILRETVVALVRRDGAAYRLEVNAHADA